MADEIVAELLGDDFDDLTEDQSEAEGAAEPEGKAEDAPQEEPSDQTESPEEGEEPDKPEEAPEVEQASKTVPLKALDAERHKRQEAQTQLEEAQATLRHLEAMLQAKGTEQQNKDPVDLGDPLDDPEAFKVKLGEQFVSKTDLQDTERKATENALIALSVAQARRSNPDFDEVLGERFAHWAPLVQDNPSLGQKAIASGDPGQFMYDKIKEAAILKDAGGLEAMLAKAREEGARDALKGKQQKATETVKAALEQQPKATASVAGADPRAEEVSEDYNMEDLLGSKKRGR